MSAAFIVEAMRGAWLTLAFMMLLSRAAFQLAGPVRMRSFLDVWQTGSAKRLWGAVTVAFAVFLVAAAASADGSFRAFDLLLLAALVGVLGADGLVNALPSGFETFKDRVQTAWVSRAGGARAGDRHLFATVNAALAVVAGAVALVVILYRSIAVTTVAVAAAAAVALTAGLIGLALLTRERPFAGDVSDAS
jgi:hypothetical protein